MIMRAIIDDPMRPESPIDVDNGLVRITDTNQENNIYFDEVNALCWQEHVESLSIDIYLMTGFCVSLRFPNDDSGGKGFFNASQTLVDLAKRSRSMLD